MSSQKEVASTFQPVSSSLQIVGLSNSFTRSVFTGDEIGQKQKTLPVRKTHLRTKCAAAAAPKFGKQMLVFVPPHPLVKHWVAILRNSSTPPAIFRNALAELGRILTYEAVRDWLPTMSGEIETPCGVSEVEFVDPTKPIAVVPILLAGLALGEQIATVVPHSRTYHLGISRDEETLRPSFFLNKLPTTFEEGTKVLLLDPLLATGATIEAALDEVVARGVSVENLRIVSAISASPALKKLSERFPGLRIYTGIIDSGLNEKGYIVPGLGNAEERSFGN